MIRKRVPDPLFLQGSLVLRTGQTLNLDGTLNGDNGLNWNGVTGAWRVGGATALGAVPGTGVMTTPYNIHSTVAQNGVGFSTTGNLTVNSGGSNGGMKIGSIAADTNYACIWSGQATPSFANAAFFANATATTVGAPAAGSVSLRCGNDTTAHLQLTQAAGIILDRGDSSASPGNATVSKTSGLVAVANGASSVTITNTRVTTSSIVIAVLQDNTDAIYVRSVVPASGSFTINLSGATSGARKVGFLVLNS